MNPFIVFVDDDSRYQNFLEMVQENVNKLTGGRVDVVLVIGVSLAGAKPLVLAAISARKEAGQILEGIVIDVADQFNDDKTGGVSLLNDIRREPGFRKGEVRIILVTITGHIKLSDAPEADDLVSRMNGATPLEAAKRLLADFNLQNYIK